MADYIAAKFVNEISQTCRTSKHNCNFDLSQSLSPSMNTWIVKVADKIGNQTAHWQPHIKLFGVLLYYILFVQRLWMAPASKGALLNIHYCYYYYIKYQGETSRTDQNILHQ